MIKDYRNTFISIAVQANPGVDTKLFIPLGDAFMTGATAVLNIICTEVAGSQDPEEATRKLHALMEECAAYFAQDGVVLSAPVTTTPKDH